MDHPTRDAIDAILTRVTTGAPRVPGVVAMVTDRERNVYEGAAGVRHIGMDTPIGTDDVFALFSATKAITGTAALQLVEDGRLDLDAPASTYVSELGTLQVIDGFDSAGNPVLRPPKRDVTTRMLLTHTAGFGYEFYNAQLFRLVTQKGHPSITTGTMQSLMTPLVFDPGDAWEYGIGMDWCGLVIERITGQRLGEFFAERIFTPLGMTDTGFALTPDRRARLATIHARMPDGSLHPLDPPPEGEPPVDMGGGGLRGTVPDYMRFIRMWLDDGAGPHGRVLRPETVRMAERNQLAAHQTVVKMPTRMPHLTTDTEIFPGLSKGWSFSMMINNERAPTGRPAGSLGWSGLANLFFWIDRASGIGGFWATQILPFGDPVSLTGDLDFETAVYAA
jgi:methyl acetate hydrolase